MLAACSANLTLFIVIILIILIWVLIFKVFLSSVYYFYILMLTGILRRVFGVTVFDVLDNRRAFISR